MAPVKFDVVHRFDAPPRVVWDEMVDWKGHEKWIPMTRVEMGEGDPASVGFEFVAFTGFWKLALEDRMRVDVLEWDDESSSGRCEVVKLGPILTGRAGFSIEPSGDGTELRWFEDVEAKYLPRFAAPIAGWLGAKGFQQGMRRLSKMLARPTSAS